MATLLAEEMFRNTELFTFKAAYSKSNIPCVVPSLVQTTYYLAISSVTYCLYIAVF